MNATSAARIARAEHLRAPELLAPAGDWECARAAVENGADAIYFGLEKFNARMRANNFSEADLPGLMEFLHRRGVRGYVTFNTLVFPEELRQAEQYLRAIISAGVDAAIVQDVGICRLIRILSPDFPIHASTQMTITSAAGIAFAKELGANLVVLARECSIADIQKIQDSLPAGQGNAPSGAGIMPLEVFVHGALCVAYSGQCLTSESLGGRSANRGECAQACRMPYELVSDGRTIPLGDRKYLLSPQDLAGIKLLPDLIRARVASLKIEGRLKSPEYVANITGVYRRALDKAVADLAKGRDPQSFFTSTDLYDLEMGFSRGLYSGWFRGINNQELVHARFGKKRGVYLGIVERINGQQIAITREGSLKPGDGVVFDSGHPEQPEQGGRVYEVLPRGNQWLLRFGHGAVDFQKVHPGDRVWKTSDPDLDRRLRQTFRGDKPRFQRPLHFEVHGAIAIPLTVIARDDEGHIVRISSAIPLEQAQNRPLTTELLREQLGRLGGTPFKIGSVENHLQGAVILPLSELNRIRRTAAAEIEHLRAAPRRWMLNRVLQVPQFETGSAPLSQPELIILVRNMEQLRAALNSGVTTIYCEFEDPKRYREAVATVHSSHARIWVAPPRITKPGEDWILNQVRSCNADGYLVRNYDHLDFFGRDRRIGDFSLNIANALSAEFFKNRFGLERLTASYDLNSSQLESLLRSAPPEWFEIALHQHMPMFHMEHCVFCAFLSSGTDYRNCGRPCDKHDVSLRDRVGAEHPLKADAGCRNTVFNSRAQTGAEFLERFLALGARSFRLEFLNETDSEVERTIAQYRRLLRSEITGAQLWRELKLINQLGVTRGQLAAAAA